MQQCMYSLYKVTVILQKNDWLHTLSPQPSWLGRDLGVVQVSQVATGCFCLLVSFPPSSGNSSLGLPWGNDHFSIKQSKWWSIKMFFSALATGWNHAHARPTGGSLPWNLNLAVKEKKKNYWEQLKLIHYNSFLQINTLTLFNFWRSSHTLAPIFRKLEESHQVQTDFLSFCLWFQLAYLRTGLLKEKIIWSMSKWAPPARWMWCTRKTLLIPKRRCLKYFLNCVIYLWWNI